MSAQQSDVLDFLPAPPTVEVKSHHTLASDDKNNFEHVEDTEMGDLKSSERDIVYDAQEDNTKPRTGLRRLFRRNPSLEFMREVAAADAEPLPEMEVKKVGLITARK